MPTTSESSLPRAGLYHPLDLRSDAVDEWVAGLPLANLGETCRLLFASLREINAGELAAAQRYKTLEALRETLHYLGNALRQRFLGTAFPLPVKTRKIANLLREMQLEMAKGYQAAAHQILLQNSLRQDGDTLTTSLQRALYYFGQSFLAGYQIYSDPEPSHWREVYGLYPEAERRGLHLGAILDKFKHGNPGTTISKTFKQILLLTLADPLRLTQTEMTAAYHLLETAAEQCQLHLAADAVDSPAFLVDLNSKTPPVRLFYSDVSVHNGCRWLDSAALLHTVRAMLAEAGPDHSLIVTQTADKKTDKLPRNLLQRLLMGWGAGGKRGFTRLPYRSTATLQFGLRASHEAVDGPRQGAVVTVRGAPGGSGVVRWMSQPPGKGVFFGVQMLVPSAIPITLRLADKDETERDYLKGLLLPPLPSHESTQTLLTPAFVYRSGDVVSVRVPEQCEQRYRLIRAVESTQVFTRFHFEPISAVIEEEPPRTSRRREQEFDSVWSGL